LYQLPTGAVAVAETHQLGAVLERFEKSVPGKFFESPLVQSLLAKSPPVRRLQAALRVASRQLNMDVWTLNRKMLADRAALGIYLSSKNQPQILLAIRPADQQLLADAWERMKDVLILVLGDQYDDSATAEGSRVVSLGDKVFIARRQDVLLLSSDSALLQKGLRAQSSKNLEVLAASSFGGLPSAMGTNHLFQGFLDVGPIRAANKERASTYKSPAEENALGALLFGGFHAVGKQAKFVGAISDLKPDRWTTTLRMDVGTSAMGLQHAGFFPTAGLGAPTIPDVPGRIGGVALYRDLSGLYPQRGKLLSTNAQSAFDRGMGQIANLLPGMDIGADVLPTVGPRMVFLAAQPEYAGLGGSPGVKIPAMALVVELKDADKAADFLSIAYHSIVTFMNFTARERGGHAVVPSSASYHGVQVAYCRPLKPVKGTRLPMEYNFSPAAARVGDRFIISTQLPLCQKLIDYYAANPSETAKGSASETVVVSPQALAKLIESNSDALTAQMVQSGTPAVAGRLALSTVQRMLQLVKTVQAHSTAGKSSYEAVLEFEFQ
jgi:hypothetical protein